jgi:hypothetical protein
MIDLLLFPGIVLLAYIGVAAILGGYFYRTSSKDKDDIFFMAAGFPITLFWYLFIKPLTKLGVRLGSWKLTKEEAKRENLRLIRKQLDNVQWELKEANNEVERMLSEKENNKMVAE